MILINSQASAVPTQIHDHSISGAAKGQTTRYEFHAPLERQVSVSSRPSSDSFVRPSKVSKWPGPARAIPQNSAKRKRPHLAAFCGQPGKTAYLTIWFSSPLV
jgi:hypothetical protein